MNIFIYGDDIAAGVKSNLNSDEHLEFYNDDEVWFGKLMTENKTYSNFRYGRSICGKNTLYPELNASQSFERDMLFGYCGNINKIKEIELFIIMLGTHDFSTKYNVSTMEIVDELNGIIKKFKFYCPKAEVMVITPPMIEEGTPVTSKEYVNGSIKSVGFNYQCFKLCKNNGFIYVSGLNAEVGEDGVYLTKHGHECIREHVNNAICKMKQEISEGEME